MKRIVPAVAVLLAAGLAVAVVAAEERASASTWLTPAETLERQQAGEALVLDVRTPAEFRAGHVPGALNVPYDQVGAAAEELARRAAGRQIVLYCHSGRRAGIAEGILRARGFHEIYQLRGELAGWQAAGLPVER